MASQNKKNKARNSYMENGGERRDDKMKRINYYKKRDRQKLKVCADIAQLVERQFCKLEVDWVQVPLSALVTPYEVRRPTGDVPAQSVRKPAQMGDK